MANYLFEIGTEELPPKAINILLEYSQNFFEEKLKDFFSYQTPENISIFSTPRRLAILLKNLKDKKEPQEIIIIGPPAKVSFDNEGKFTKAAISFAEKNNIPLENLKVITTEKGEYLAATIIKEGEDIKERIKEVLKEFFENLPPMKTMRWENSGFRFPRPIRWIVSLLDDKVIDFEIAGVKADRYTYLHRFMTNPVGRGEKKELKDALSYEEITKLGFIIANRKERKEAIEKTLSAFGKVLNAEAILDQDLIDEVTDLTEYPVAIVGDFNPEYLILPKEVIITVCKHHQRYFNFIQNDKLIPKFLAFSNNSVKDKEVIKNGYEKVLKARLEDALFFYKEDLKKNLDELYEKLSGIQFHEKLGSIKDKVERNKKIALIIAGYLKDVDLQKLERANKLSKVDLVTEMVKEFDELQGIMGRYYALKQGEEQEVADAIYEHYLPKTAEDQLPTTKIGTILALADKIDTLISFFSIGEIPKGASDPFGLRRNAIGVVRLLVEKELDIDLKELLEKLTDNQEVIEQLLEFITNRFEGLYKYDKDIINAVLSTKEYNLYRAKLKIEAISELKKREDFEDIITVFKRVGRIIPQDFEGVLKEDLLSQKEEKELYQKMVEIKDKFNKKVENKEYQEALLSLLKLKPYIDKFFDNVMVMVDNQQIKINRLALLNEINDLFKKIADFTKINV